MQRVSRHLLPVIIGIMVLAATLVFGKFEFLQRFKDAIVYQSSIAIPGVAVCPDCNIILVDLDVVRADNLPCYGYRRDTAPNLCAFAQQNNYFTRFYSQTSFTLDNHTSMMTGLYPSTHHVLVPMKDTVNVAIPTLAQTLQNSGYQTIYAGLVNDPNIPLDNGLERGFTHIEALPSGGAGWRQGYLSLLPKLLDHQRTFIFLYTNAAHSPYLAGPGPRRYSQDVFPTIPVTESSYRVDTMSFYRFVLSEFQKRLAASDTLESKTRNSGIIQDLAPAVWTNDIARVRQIFHSLYSFEQNELYISWYWKGIDPTNQAAAAYIQSLYDERIHALDEDLAPLLAFVSRPEVKRKTIVIITSDHGEEFGEHGFFDHGWNIYNTVTHVPFIIASPHIRHNPENSLGQSIDIFPTILELVGVKPLGPVEGKSLVPTLMGKGGGDSYLVSQFRGETIQSIQDGRWKLYHYTPPDGKPWSMLVDLISDPQELTDVIADNPDEVTRLERALQGILSASPVYAPVQSEFPRWIDWEKRQRLIERGYF